MAYLFHYIPFWLMGRSKFLHHYMPALIIKYCLFGCLFETFLSFILLPSTLQCIQLIKGLPLLNDHQNPFMVLWKTAVPTVYIRKPSLSRFLLITTFFFMLICTISAYLYLCPMTYAFTLTPQQIKARKLFSSWDFQYAAK